VGTKVKSNTKLIKVNRSSLEYFIFFSSNPSTIPDMKSIISASITVDKKFDMGSRTTTKNIPNKIEDTVLIIGAL